MAINKHALIRYKVLDNCFRNPYRRYFIQDLIEEIEINLREIDPKSKGISRRQVFEDINFMESPEGWNIELVKSKVGKRVYYRYSDSGFSINSMPLNELEIEQLHSALHILSHFKGLPQFDWIQELILKLRNGVIAPKNTPTIINFDSNQYLTGIENLGVVYNSIFYKKVVEIDYQPFGNADAYKMYIHPYYLKQYNNRWFVFGFNPAVNKADWNLALDRIISITETSQKYIESPQIDWSEYFEDIIGVTKPTDQNPEEVTLIFSGKTCNYIESKPIHGSQKSYWIEGEKLKVTLNIIINYEFERLILSYSDSLTIISPQKLKNTIKTRLQNALDSV